MQSNLSWPGRDHYVWTGCVLWNIPGLPWSWHWHYHWHWTTNNSVDQVLGPTAAACNRLLSSEPICRHASQLFVCWLAVTSNDTRTLGDVIPDNTGPRLGPGRTWYTGHHCHLYWARKWVTVHRSSDLGENWVFPSSGVEIIMEQSSFLLLIMSNYNLISYWLVLAAWGWRQLCSRITKKKVKSGQDEMSAKCIRTLVLSVIKNFFTNNIILPAS